MDTHITQERINLDDDQTPLTHEEREGLIPSYITLRSELNEAEQANILGGEDWAHGRARDEMKQRFLNNSHKRMFGNVWKWAGKFRTSAKNIGIDAYKIPTELEQLFNDTRYWKTPKTYEPDEIAARFHHRPFYIHPCLLVANSRFSPVFAKNRRPA